MTDNVTTDAGSGGATFATDDDGSAHHPYVKVEFGADNTQTPVSSANPLPVDASGVAVPVTDNSGSLTVDNAGTFAVQESGSALTNLATLAGAVSGTEMQVDIVSGAVTNAGTFAVQEDGSALTNLGTIAGAVSGSEMQVDIVSGNVTNAGTFAVQESGSVLTNLGTIAGAVSGTEVQVDIVSGNVTNAGTFATQESGSALTHLATLAAAVSTEVQVDVVGALPAGTNAIGKLAANSGVDIGDVDVTSQPARDRTTDNVGAALVTDALMDDTTACTPKFAAIDAASSGDNTIVAAVTGKKIRVVSAFLVAAGDVNTRFESGASGSALTGQMNLTTNSGFVLPFNPVGWFETASSAILNLELSGATSVDGSITYIEV